VLYKFWSAVTVNEVEKLIASALNKTCQLDPAPTWLVKEMPGHRAPFIALMFNRLLVTGCFPAVSTGHHTSASEEKWTEYK